jgi:hypothetical protein
MIELVFYAVWESGIDRRKLGLTIWTWYSETVVPTALSTISSVTKRTELPLHYILVEQMRSGNVILEPKLTKHNN